MDGLFEFALRLWIHPQQALPLCRQDDLLVRDLALDQLTQTTMLAFGDKTDMLGELDSAIPPYHQQLIMSAISRDVAMFDPANDAKIEQQHLKLMNQRVGLRCCADKALADRAITFIEGP